VSTVSVSTEGSQQREFLGHPVGLWVCFGTEMWERFSYYGMRAILVLYLTKYHLYSTEKATMVLGAYMAMVYMTPILGGYLADRFLGSRKAVVYGGLLLVLGHVLMGFHGAPAFMDGETVVRDDSAISFFFLSLGLIVGGMGFLKANISTIVGSLYGPNDPRRDGGFSIFYMGINIGSFTSIAIVGYVGENIGWNYGFALAGICMLFGLLVFLKGQPLLEGRADPPNPEELKQKSPIGLSIENTIYLGGLVLVLLSWQLLQYQAVVGNLLLVCGAIMVGIVGFYSFKDCTKEERHRLFVAMFLITLQPLFWALFEQQAGSLTLLADQKFDLNFLGMTFVASQVQSMNPLFIIVFAPVMAWLWVSLARKGLDPSTPAKFAIAMLLIGGGFVLFALALGLDESSSKSFMWLVMLYWFMTVAELCISPIGLSMITKLSVPKIVGMMMGVWFLGLAFGNYLSGVIGSLTGSGGHGAAAGDVSVAATIELYTNVGLFGIAVGVVVLLLTPLLRKGMHGVH